MKVHFYIRTEDLEYLNNLLKDYDNLEEPVQIHHAPIPESVMVSISLDDYIRLDDNNCLSVLLSL